MSQAYLDKLKTGAIDTWHKHKILPSICGAQAALESGYGGSKLSLPPYNNQFGIKSSPDWTGRVVEMPTQEWNGSAMVTVYAKFRVYDSIDDSVRDHGAFFTSTEWRRNNYKNVVGEKNYKVAAQALRDAGYATDPNYPSKLISIIERYNLQEWDRIALNNLPTTDRVLSEKVVGGSITANARNYTNQVSITVIGDSLGVGTKPYLQEYGWNSANYNVYGSRQWTHPTPIYDGIVQLRDFIAKGTLNDVVIFIMGTNRGVRDSEIKTALDLIGPNRKLLLVDTASEVGHRESVAYAYRNASKTYPNVFYVNWSQRAIPNIASWYASDGANGTHIHMNGTGYRLHAEYIVQAVYEALTKSWVEVQEDSGIGEEKVELTISELDYSDGVYVSPRGENVVYNPELNDRFGFKTSKGRVMWIDSVLEVDGDNQQEMMAQAIEYMKKRATPAAQYTIKLKEWNHNLSIGDTGIFIDHEFNPPLYIEARILNITTSDTNENSNTITIGNVVELHPQDKEDIIQLQKDLAKVRDDLIARYKKDEPVNVEIFASNGSIIPKDGYVGPKERALNTANIKEFTDGFTIEVEKPRKTSNTFYFYGKVLNNQNPKPESERVIVDSEPVTDITRNPQGEPGPENDAELLTYEKLKVGSFTADFIGASGETVYSGTIPLYEDSVFNHPVTTKGDPIKKIIIHTDTPLAVTDVSLKEVGETTIEKTMSTKLTVKMTQGNDDITGIFTNFRWSRVSSNARLDEGWNDAHKFITGGNTLFIYPDDIFNNESIFICRVYDDEWKEVIGSASIVIQTSVEGKSAYELAVENGFVGTESEWIESLKGTDGKDGIPGPPGPDGKQTFIHTAWANSPLGDGFSTSDSTGKSYIGFYTDDKKEDPQDYSLYKWTKIEGKNGKSFITYIAYANSDDGTKDFSRTETNRDYMGQYVREAPNNLAINPGPITLTKSQGFVEFNTITNLEFGKDYIISFVPTFGGATPTPWEVAEGNGTNTHVGEWSANPTYIFEGVE